MYLRTLNYMIMPDKCYICLEECEDISPCECSIPLHVACLECMQTKMPNQKCTICKTSFDLEAPGTDELSEERATDELSEERAVPNVVEHTATICCTATCVLAFYILFGWIGKLLFLAMGMPLSDDFAIFWSIEHLRAFILGIFSIPFLAFMHAFCEGV